MVCRTTPRSSRRIYLQPKHFNRDAIQSSGKSIFPTRVTLCPTLAGCDRTTYNVFSTLNQNFPAPYFFNYNLNMEKGLGTAGRMADRLRGSQGRKLLLRRHQH